MINVKTKQAAIDNLCVFITGLSTLCVLRYERRNKNRSSKLPEDSADVNAGQRGVETTV
jgi:hypothetical protein